VWCASVGQNYLRIFSSYLNFRNFKKFIADVKNEEKGKIIEKMMEW
jgi:hypothetical protein